jgi:hypothetical protein
VVAISGVTINTRGSGEAIGRGSWELGWGSRAGPKTGNGDGLMGIRLGRKSIELVNIINIYFIYIENIYSEEWRLVCINWSPRPLPGEEVRPGV